MRAEARAKRSDKEGDGLGGREGAKRERRRLTTQTPGHNREPSPLKTLEEVVGTENLIESVAVGDASFLGSFRSKRSKSEVGVKVGGDIELEQKEGTRAIAKREREKLADIKKGGLP